jgi:protein tyrosine phosphatase
VKLQGYHQTNAYIVTQWPLNETIGDIWRLVYDYNIQSIVVLNSEMPTSVSFNDRWCLTTEALKSQGSAGNSKSASKKIK